VGIPADRPARANRRPDFGCDRHRTARIDPDQERLVANCLRCSRCVGATMIWKLVMSRN